MVDINPKTLSKEELERISSGVNIEEIAEFDRHSLHVFVEPRTIIEAKEPGSCWVRVKNNQTGAMEEIIDCTSMNWALALGFAHPDVNYAVVEQIKRLTHVKSGCLTPARIKFCNKLAEMSPGQCKGGRVCINNEGGGLALEAAIKLAIIASKGADHFLAFFHGYHGSSLAMAAVTQPFHVATRFKPFGLEHFTRVPFPHCYHCLWKYKNGLYGKRDPACNLECFDLIEKYLMGMAPQRLAGVIIEPYQGAGGHYPAPPEFLQKLKETCAREKIFLIYDESQTGVWRTGKYFTLTEKYEKELGIDVSPDMIAYTKAVGGGFPLGAMVASQKIKKRFSPTEEHTTFSSSPIGCVAGLTTFKVIEKEKINENCEERGKQITKRLLELQEKYDVIGDIRGPGLFIGIELVKDRETREPYTHLMEDMLIEGAKQQVFFGPSMPIMSFSGKMVMRNLIKIKPPLLISEEDADFVCDKFESTLKASLENIKK